jgi:16S rRNA (guanine527-N7)-methyltransferase
VLRGGGDVLDVGSGAGLPGIPLAIAYPKLRVTLLDATAKKTAFLNHVVETLGLVGVGVLTGRAESLAHDTALRESYDVVVSRAVARLSVLVELTLPFCRVGGTVIAQKAFEAEKEAEDAAGALAALGGELGEVIQVTVPDSGERRILVTVQKVSPTPSRYPRRPGMPSKRPL